MTISKAVIVALLVGGLACSASAESNRRRFEEITPPPIECSRIADCLDDAGDVAADSLTSGASDPADAGVVRMGVDEDVCWEINPAGDDVCLGLDSGTNFLTMSGYATSALDLDGRSLVGFAAIYADGNSGDTGVVNLANDDPVCWEGSPAGTDICMQVDDTESLVTNIASIQGHYQGYPAVPLPDLKSVVVSDLDHDGDYDNDDFTAALTACSPGCNLILLPVTYTDVRMTIDASPDLTSGLAIVGAGIGRSILQSHVRTGTGDDYYPVIDFEAGSPTTVFIQDLAIDGRSLSQNAGETADPDDCLTESTAGNDVGINFETADSSLPSGDYLIRRVHIHHTLGAAIKSYDFSGITVEDSVFEYLGCAVAPEGPECSPTWAACSDHQAPPAGRKRATIGVWIGNNSDDFTLRRNIIRYTTKFGAEVLASPTGTPHPCDVADAPVNSIIEDNEVGPVAGDSGINLNGACSSIIRRNYVHDVTAFGDTANSVGYGIGLTTMDRALVENNVVENIHGTGIRGASTSDTPDASSYAKIIKNRIIDPCQGILTACAGISASGPGGQYPYRVIAQNTVEYRDARASGGGLTTAGLLVNNIKETDIYENQFEGLDYGIFMYDTTDVDIWANSLVRRGAESGTVCWFFDNTSGGSVPSSTYFHTSNTCVGSFATESQDPGGGVIDRCVALACTESLGVCATNADCPIANCNDSANGKDTTTGCATPVTTTTTTTLPSVNFDAPPLTFPLGDATLAYTTGRLHYGTKTECIFLEARDGLCDTASGCLNPSPSIAGTNHDYMTMDFETSADTTGSWTFQLPKNLVGQIGEVQFIWTSNNAACNAGTDDDVCWNIDAGSVADDEAFNVTVLDGVATAISDKCLANGDLMKSAPLTFTHGLRPAETAVVSVTRDIDGGTCTAAGDDDYTEMARLVAVRFCFETNNLFSGE